MKYKLFLFLFFLCVGFLIGKTDYSFFDTRLPEQKVIELAIQGRMGNLMFQYAGAYSYAKEHHKKLYVSGDLSELQRAFGLKVDYSKNKPLAYSRLTEVQRVKAKLAAKYFDLYDPAFDQNEYYGLISGFFQDPQFFRKYEKDIRQLFSFKEKLTPENEKIIKAMNETNSVSVHIRRGDYVPKQNYHFLLPENYYTRAADYIAERVPNPHFYIFSDDIEWAQQNIHLKYPHTFVTHNREQSSYNDMRLMSVCKHNIIANSSFSWWGAWLNPNPNKIIIAPISWLNDDGRWGQHILPKEWIQIPNSN